MTKIDWPKSLLLTCSEDVTARLLRCAKPEVFRKERAGLLTHTPFWRDWGRAFDRQPFFPDYWDDYDVRHYNLDEVLSLLPANSEMAEWLTLLKRAHKDIMAGQIVLGVLYPRLLVRISKSGTVIRSRLPGKASRSHSSLRGAEARRAR